MQFTFKTHITNDSHNKCYLYRVIHGDGSLDVYGEPVKGFLKIWILNNLHKGTCFAYLIFFSVTVLPHHL